MAAETENTMKKILIYDIFGIVGVRNVIIKKWMDYSVE